MQSKKSTTQSRLLWILVPLGLCLLLWLGFRAVFITPYERFREQEVEAELLLEQLNEEIFAQIPPPEGVVEESKVQNTASFYHGATLFVDYTIIDVQPNDVLAYYEQLLLPAGWSRYEGLIGEHETLYYRDTSCVQILMSTDDYLMGIYHDFRNQEFSPKMPPLWLVRLHEFSETSIDRCPPDSDP